MTSLKQVTPSIQKHATQIWVKSLGSQSEKEDNPTYPYVITEVDQIVPTREHMESFEAKRNQLDKVMPAGKKLETVNCFYSPPSDGFLKKLLNSDWRETFLYQVDSLTFYSNVVDAIKANDVPFYRVIQCRLSLGREGIDYTQPTPTQYKIKDLTAVTSAFLYTFKNTLVPHQQIYSSSTIGLQSPLKNSSSSISPLKTSSSSIVSPLKSSTTTSVPTPSTNTDNSANSTPNKSVFNYSVENNTSFSNNAQSPNKSLASEKLIGDGFTCPSCQKENTGNTKYCIRCGGFL